MTWSGAVRDCLAIASVLCGVIGGTCNVYIRDGHETAWTDQPEASLGRCVEVCFSWPFVPEGQL